MWSCEYLNDTNETWVENFSGKFSVVVVCHTAATCLSETAKHGSTANDDVT